MTKRRPTMLVEWPEGRIVVRAWGKGFRVKVTCDDGDAAKEMKLAGLMAELLQEVTRSVTGQPDLKLHVGPIRHIDDHEAAS